MYIVLGIISLMLLLILLFADKFATYSTLMSSFNKGEYKKFMFALSALTVVFLSYGIYHELTNQPPFLDVQIKGVSYTIFGDIGEIGYYADGETGLIYKGEEANIHLVAWEELAVDKAKIIVQYPSGKEEVWETKLSPINQSSISSLKENYHIKNVYNVSSYTFKEKGNVKLSITNGKKKLEKLNIKVKEQKNAQD